MYNSGVLLTCTGLALCCSRFLFTIYWGGLTSSELFHCVYCVVLHVPIPLLEVALDHFRGTKVTCSGASVSFVVFHCCSLG